MTIKMKADTLDSFSYAQTDADPAEKDAKDAKDTKTTKAAAPKP